MKTLKKTLCLVLAVVMAVGVLVLPASAVDYEDYTDVKEIEHTTAAKVLTALGIIEGKEDGSYAPDDILSRAEGAKILVEMLLGKNAQYLDKNVSSFSDVPAGNWAAGYVGYAASAGIIDGDGTGKFNPTDTLTGHQLAKLLLVAMGVDGDYTGDSWKIDVGLNAGKSGLLADLGDLSLSDPINRDDAIQMTFNAMNYSPTGGTEEYVVYIDKNGNNVVDADEASSVVYRGDSAVEALLMKQANDKTGENAVTYTIIIETKKEDSLGYSVFGLQNSKHSDAFGRTSESWVGNDKVEVVLDLAPVAKYEGTPVTAATLMKDLGFSSVNDQITVTTITDGSRGTETDSVKRTDSKTFGAYGALTEVYKTADKQYDIFVINTYVKKLDNDKDIVKAAAATSTKDAVDAHIVLERENNAANGNPTLTFKTDAFKKNDVVIYTKSTGTEAVNVVLAPSFGGTVTATGSGYIRVDGERYTVAAKAPESGSNAIPSRPSNTPLTFYTDSYKNLIFAETASDSTSAVTYPMAYVIASAYKTDSDTTEGDNLFTSGTTTSSAQAQLRVANIETGEISVEERALAQSTDGTWYYAASNGAASTELLKPEGDKNDGKQVAVGKFYYYTTLDNGQWVLMGEVKQTSVTLEKDKTSVGQVDKLNLFANASTKVTKLVLAHKDNDDSKDIVSVTVNTVAGYASFPAKSEIHADAVVAYDTNTGLVSSILYTENFKPAAPVPTYAIYGGKGETVLDSKGAEVTMHTFYVNGEAVEYAYSGSDLTEGKLYTITVRNGTATVTDNVTTTHGTVAYYDGSLLLIEGASGTVNVDANCIIMDADDDYKTAEVEAGDVIDYATANDKVAIIVINYAPAE